VEDECPEGGGEREVLGRLGSPPPSLKERTSDQNWAGFNFTLNKGKRVLKLGGKEENKQNSEVLCIAYHVGRTGVWGGKLKKMIEWNLL